ARLRARYGRAWRRRAPVESLMPLRLARYGVPLSETGAAGLAAAGIEPAVLSPGARNPGTSDPGAANPGTPAVGAAPDTAADQDRRAARALPTLADSGAADVVESSGRGRAALDASKAADTSLLPDGWHLTEEELTKEQSAEGPGSGLPDERVPQEAASGAAQRQETAGRAPSGEEMPQVTVPVAPGRVRALRNAQLSGYAAGTGSYVPPQREAGPSAERELFVEPFPGTDGDTESPVSGLPDDVPRDEAYFAAYRQYVAESGVWPDSRQFGRYLLDHYGVRGRSGGPLSESYLRGYTRDFRDRLRMEMQTEQTP
ncbi:DUF2637 domain-containing protein, partial [Streptomyces sp. 8N706]